MVDLYNFNKDHLTSNPNMVSVRNRGASSEGNKRRFEFAYIPNLDFLADPYPLNKGIELKISFDRAPFQCALIQLEPPTTEESGSIAIHDCHAYVDFVSSPFYRNYFASVESTPTLYTYETTDVLIR